MAEQHVSAILEQVRATKSDRSSPQFVDAAASLVRRLETVRFKMDALKHWPLSVQLSRIEIDGCALDEVLYDIEDLFSGSNTQLMQSNTQLMQSNIQTDAAETLKVSRNPKSTIRIVESRMVPNLDSLYPNIMDLDARFVSSVARLELELMNLKSKLSPKPESVSVKVSKLYGIRQVKNDILDVILGESSEERSDDIKTISIVGMEGMGKTSLARCICEDHRVVASFDNVIFVNVSDDFDLGRIARAIIQALEGLKHEFLCILTLAPLQSLLDRIHWKIVNEKSLLVLDGVEGYDCDDWSALKSVFQHGMPENRILITTREHRVAVAMESSYMFRLKELSDELCWTILRGVALDGLDKDSHEYVEDMGLEIAKRCEGSPFAAKVLGCVLQHKIKRSEWNSVLNNYIWESPIIPKYIFKTLWLSYCDLPWSIRRCLLYCVIFPKNFEISRTLLVQHWMAQGYLDSWDYSEMELKGEHYFKCLVAHSFLQDFSRNGGIHTWKMHSIVHDFVRFLFQSELMMEINSVEHMGLDLTSARISEDKAVKCSIPAPKKMKTPDFGTSIPAASCDLPLISDVPVISIRHLILMIAQGIGFPVDISVAEKLRTLVAVSQGCFITSRALSTYLSNPNISGYWI
ncbi:hypothetical protein GQ457_02G038330 [Hibiscus cannabinus]